MIYDSSTGEDSQEILYTDKIKIARVGESETDLVISDFYKTYLENYPGFSVNATFDATAQKIFIEAQKVEPSLFAAANVETWLIPDVVETAPGSGELEMFGPSQGAISYDGDVVMISLRTHPGDTQNYISFQLCPVEISTGQIGHYIFWSWETDWEKLADEQVDAPTLAPVKHAPSPKYIYSPGKSYKQAYTRR